MYRYEINIREYLNAQGEYVIDVGGDFHIGAVGFDEGACKKFLNTPNPKILTGDLLEAITPVDKRFSESQHKNPIIGAFCYLKHMLMVEAKADILLLLRGNHEQTIFNTLGNFYENAFKSEGEVLTKGGLCVDMGIRYGGSLSYIILKDGKGHRTRWQVAHGNGAMTFSTGEPKRRSTNKKLKIKQIQDKISDADAYFMGHTHRLGVCEPDFLTKLTYDFKTKKMIYAKIADNPRWYANTGSFLRVYADGDGNYAEDRMVEPAEIGWIRVHMDQELNILRIEEIDPHAV